MVKRKKAHEKVGRCIKYAAEKPADGGFIPTAVRMMFEIIMKAEQCHANHLRSPRTNVTTIIMHEIRR